MKQRVPTKAALTPDRNTDAESVPQVVVAMSRGGNKITVVFHPKCLQESDGNYVRRPPRPLKIVSCNILPLT